MSSCWERGPADRNREFQTRVTRTEWRVRSRQFANRGRRQPPGEALACPRCRRRFTAGGLCPDCAVLLVGESFVASAPPERPRRLPLDDWAFVGFVAATATYVATLAVVILAV